jgi:hypothetical protein
MRRRKIQKYGDSYAIKLDPSDIRDFGLVEGDIVDIDDLFIECEKEKKQ